MVANQSYYGLDEEGFLICGIFMYIMESGDEQWPDEHVVLYEERGGITHWIDFGHFCRCFHRTTVLDKHMMGW